MSVCVNDESDRLADFVCANDRCEQWEAKRNGSPGDEETEGRGDAAGGA